LSIGLQKPMIVMPCFSNSLFVCDRVDGLQMAVLQIWLKGGGVHSLILHRVSKGPRRGDCYVFAGYRGVGDDVPVPLPDLRQYRTDPALRAAFENLRAYLARCFAAASRSAGSDIEPDAPIRADGLAAGRAAFLPLAPRIAV
jgi:hypothetical protein